MGTFKQLYSYAMIGIAILVGVLASEPVHAQQPYKTPAESLDAWRSNRLGMFIHWGPVTLTGLEISWSRANSNPACPNNGPTPVYVYDNLYTQFNPTNFNAAEWVAIAQAAGMKYIVFTAKHCDGFLEWDSKASDYNIMNSPFHRDVCAELATAAHAAGMGLGWYFSPMDWKDPRFRTDQNAAFIQTMQTELTELLTNYGKIDLLWFDTDGCPNVYDVTNTYALVRSLQPDIVIDNRLDMGSMADYWAQNIGPWADYYTPEQNIGGFDNQRPWETCMTLGTQWAWKPNDTYMSLSQCLGTLLLCAGGDGNLLLDVGPDSTGAFEPQQIAPISGMGAWLAQYGESVYGTRGGPYAPGNGIVSMSNGCNNVYIHLLTPQSVVTLSPLPTNILSAVVLTGGSVTFTQTPGSVVLQLSPDALTNLVPTIKLTLNGPPCPGQVSNDRGASNITGNSATLNGRLVSTGTSATAVSVYWGASDLGTNTAGWDHVGDFGQRAVGSLSTNVTGLSQSTTYYYRFYASNSAGAAWADPASQFETLGAPIIDNDGGASNIATADAWLNGNLTAGGSAGVSFYWGTTDGGTTTSNWQHANSLGTRGQGSLSLHIWDLTPASQYYYRSYATNIAGAGWAGSTATFQTLPTSFGNWTNRMKIAFGGYTKNETLTNFPALVVFGTNIAGFAYSQFASPGGYDLRFADASGVEINYEIEQWDMNAESCVWVQVPLVRTNTAYVWAFWGNPAQTNQKAYTTNGAVWADGFAGVWHMNQTNALDSTANRNNGTAVGGMTRGAGKVGTANSFNGSSYINITNSASLTSMTNLTVSFWLQTSANSGLALTHWEINTTCGYGYHSPASCWYEGNGSWNTPSCATILDSSLHYYCLSSAGGGLTTYRDGVAGGTASFGAGPFAGTYYYLRMGADNRYPWAQLGYSCLPAGSVMDEVRVESVGRSANWLWACYMNMASNSLFNSYGATVSSSNNASTVHGIPYSWLTDHGITNTSDSVETVCLNGNGFNVLQDYIAGLDPTNRNSCFSVTITNMAGQIVVRVPSVQTNSYYPNVTRYYNIEQCTNLLTGGTWQPAPGYSGILANGGIIAYTNATQDPAKFYRAKVRLQ